MNREQKIDLLQKILNEYFNIPNDTYAYNLTRVKEAFNVGTMSLEDFEEFNEETTRDLAEFLFEKGCGLKVKNNKIDENWISIKKVGLPELEEVDKYVHKSKNVLIQTKYGDMFVAYCEKRFYYGGKSYEIKWFSHGTGGRKMKVMSTVVAWMELPEKYKGE